MKKDRFVKYKITQQDSNGTTITITEQSHTGFEFEHTTSNGKIYILISDSYPEWKPEYRRFFVRGSYENRDGDPVFISAAEWPYVKELIDEFNFYSARIFLPQKLFEWEV